MFPGILIIVLAAFVGVVVQTTAGLGFLLFLTPALLLFLDGPTAIVTALLVANVLNGLVLLDEHRKIEASPSVMAALSVSALPGIAIGAWILTLVEKEELQLIVGAVIVASAFLQQFAMPAPTRPLRPSASAGVAGFASGLLSTATSMGGPPLALWLRSRKVTKNQVRDTLAVTFVILNVVSIAAIWLSNPGSFNERSFTLALILVPVIIVGHLVGERVLGKIDMNEFRWLEFSTIAVAGAFSIVTCLL